MPRVCYVSVPAKIDPGKGFGRVIVLGSVLKQCKAVDRRLFHGDASLGRCQSSVLYPLLNPDRLQRMSL